MESTSEQQPVTAAMNGHERPLPRFVGGKPREQVVELDWPMEFDGKIYERVTIRRLTVAEIAAFTEHAMKEGNPWPAMFDLPREVLEALDPDDQDRIADVALDFLPRRLRTLAESQAAEQTPPAGADTAPSSLAPSDGPAES